MRLRKEVRLWLTRNVIQATRSSQLVAANLHHRAKRPGLLAILKFAQPIFARLRARRLETELAKLKDLLEARAERNSL
jgi:hypothetical protein